MDKTLKYFTLLLSLGFIICSVTSLALGYQNDNEKYGAGTSCDSCDDDCDYIAKYFDECFHSTPYDTCLSYHCIINELIAPACSVNESGPQDCPVTYSSKNPGWIQYKMSIKCDTDDWSTGYYPSGIGWGDCEFHNTNPGGRCFMNDYSYCECGTYQEEVVKQGWSYVCY